jgi:hypothetical protein
MIKDPQNIIKISSQSTDGNYLQMVFDSEGMTHWEMSRRFQDFMRGLTYVIDYPASPEPICDEYYEPICDECSDNLLVSCLKSQYVDALEMTSTHPEDIRHNKDLMAAITTVLGHNLTVGDFNTWFQQNNVAE